MSVERRLYAVWGGDGSLESGVIRANWTLELRERVLAAKAKAQQVKSRKEGLECLLNRGCGEYRHLLRKAELLHHRCWYCARPLHPSSVGEPDSTELEHQVPVSSGWAYVHRDENLVAACHRCNNGKPPGKGELDVPGFRRRLQTSCRAERVIFYGEILRWLRAEAEALRLSTPLTASDAEEVLGWYARSPGVVLHTWHTQDRLRDYHSGLRLPIPPDRPPYALGAPHRLPPRP